MISFIYQVIFEDYNLCCAAPGMSQCIDFNTARCLRLLEYELLTYIMASLVTVGVVLNTIALVSQHVSVSKINPVIRKLNASTFLSNMF